MFFKFAVGIVVLLIIEISTNPIDLDLVSSSDLGYQMFNSTKLLAYQRYDGEGEQKVQRNKRDLLDDVYSYLGEFTSYFDSSEEDDEEEYDDDGSGDEPSNNKSKDNKAKDKNKENYGLCHDCTVTYNQVHQVQHINRLTPDGTNQTIKATLTTPKPSPGRKTNIPPQGKNIETTLSDTVTPAAAVAATTVRKIQPVTTDAPAITTKAITDSETQNQAEVTTVATVNEVPEVMVTTIAPVAEAVATTTEKSNEIVTTVAAAAAAEVTTTVAPES